MSNYNQITLKERVRIEAGIYSGYSFHKIAKDIERSTSSVIREVKRNRIKIKMPYIFGRDCIYASNCAKKNMCDDEYCTRKCRLCEKIDCTKICDRVKNHECSKHLKSPFVCSNCGEKNKRRCIYDKYYYIAERADAKAKKTRSESRKGIRLSQQELQTLDEILSPLIRQGQPLSHICSIHKAEIKVSERSIYNYIDQGELTICNLDLRRKVKYKRRRKKQTEIKCNRFNYRRGRTYEDYLKYLEEHPGTPVVEMDTVRGLRTREHVVLTMMFVENSVMLLILLKDESMEPVIKVFDKLTKELGLKRFRKLFPVVLTDNGRCFKNALELEYTKSGLPRTRVFYCDPQASWQKPHIEKNHEFIRYVIPKGHTFKGYTQKDMTLVANHINSTIRPGLSYKSPYDLVKTEDMKKLLEILGMSPIPAEDICLSPKLLSK